MFKNYLLVAFRNLAKNKIFALINIFGLGLAMAICIVAFFNHMFNWEFDRTHINFNEIYRVNSMRDMDGREQEYGSVPATLGLHIKKDISGIERSARMFRSGSSIKKGDDIFQMRIAYVDPEFLDIFTFPLIYGEKKSIENHGNILISKKVSSTLFGNEYPIGKSVSIINERKGELTYIVGGVFEDFPQNSSFNIDILTHADNFLQTRGISDADWKLMASALFIQVKDKSLIPSITKSLKSYTEVQNRVRKDFKLNRFVLIPLKDVGSNSRTTWNSSLFPSLHPAAIVAPPVMALFILLIACFNFANTSISIFSRRLKEIGLRKAFGGQRKQLITQFMFETLVICLIALLVGIAIAKFLVPAYSSLWAYMSLKLTLTKYGFFWIFMILLLLLTGFLAGVYPAIYVSSFSPVNVIKGAFRFKGSGRLSAVLLSLQFTISVMSLVMGIVFIKNARYQETLDRGYDRDNIIFVPIPGEKYASFRNEILSNPKIISAEGTMQHIGWGAYRRPVKDEKKQIEVDFFDVGPGYPSTMGLRLTEGRMFDESRVAADRSARSVIVNRKFVEGFGWKEAVGKTITVSDTIRYSIIGVVEDFYTNGLWQKIEPAILKLNANDTYYNIAVRGKTEDLPAILEYLSLKWKGMGTNYVFGGRLQEDIMQEEKDINGSIMKVNIFLALAAMILSLTGMYNMVSLDVIKKTREMGIRKINGAPLMLLMYLMSRKFLLILFIASVLGCAAGYYLSNMLLDSIWDYFTKISAGMLLLSAFIMIAATIITIVFKILKAARRNPVDSLRYE